MKLEIRVPAIGESVKKGILSVWLKQDGDAVREEEEIYELETDKATIAVPAPASGVLHTLIEEGTEVMVDQPVAWLQTERDAAAGARPDTEVAAPAEPTPPVLPTLSPAVRRVVAEHGLDPAAITGTGKGGRITKRDALQAATAKGAVTATKDGEDAGTAVGLEAVTSESRPEPLRAGGEGAEREGGAAPAGARRQTRVAMSAVRKRIAERLVQARQSAAHLTTFNEIDMAGVMDLRARFRGEFEEQHGVKLGFMSFFVKACCHALRAYPDVNTIVDGDDILYHDFCDIGIAISTDRGLLVPVVRDAERRTFVDIERSIADLAARGKERRLLPDELTGGTFTITNGGVFGSLLSTPIPAYPQTAILGMHAINTRPMVVDDQIVARPMMYVALTYDHRVIDGKQAIGFLVKVKQLVEAPERLLLFA